MARPEVHSEGADDSFGEAATTRVQWLIDNADAYRAISAAVQSASHSICIAQLALDSDFAVGSELGLGRAPVPFIELLMDASQTRGVAVKLLLNATLLLDTLTPLRRFIRSGGPSSPHFQMRGVSHFPQLLHAKAVIVDSETAFLVGSPFVNGYWDSRSHRPYSSDRPMGELGGRPLHDVSMRISGYAVAELEAFFDELWAAGDDSTSAVHRVVGDDVVLPTKSCSPPRNIVRSIPPGILRTCPSGATEILAELERALHSARSSIYIEHQYLSSRPILHALREALQREPGLEIILVLNQNPDITAYVGWQLNALREFGLLEHPRVGLFALWSMAVSQSGHRDINQIFVHSKVVVIDDRWVMCGSANLDGVSLATYGEDFTGFVGRRIFRGIRNLDIAMSFSGMPPGGVETEARLLRRRLWQEHLGYEAGSVTTSPPYGWVSMWRNIARQNVITINSGEAVPVGSFVLPFSTSIEPLRQLEDCEVDMSAGSPRLLFNPGWLERNFSPRWIRNMFL